MGESEVEEEIEENPPVQEESIWNPFIPGLSDDNIRANEQPHDISHAGFQHLFRSRMIESFNKEYHINAQEQLDWLSRTQKPLALNADLLQLDVKLKKAEPGQELYSTLN